MSITISGEESVYMPEECWELIFKFVEVHHLASISLVCKRFLKITNQLAKSLNVSQSTVPVLPQLLHRFRDLTNINLRDFRGEIDDLLSRIAESGLDLQALDVSTQTDFPSHRLRILGSKLKNLKYLNCSQIYSLKDKDLDSIAEIFPSLEELDVSYPGVRFHITGDLDSNFFSKRITDDGFCQLSMKLKGLRKINLAGSEFITNKSLQFLSTNCVQLSEIVIGHCYYVNEEGINLLTHRCANLNSISVSGIRFSVASSIFDDPLACTKALSTVDFSDSYVSDELLCSMAKACLPLKKLILSSSCSFTVNGIVFLLSKNKILQYLDLGQVKFLTDEIMFEISKFLPSVTFINLSLCYELTEFTLFNLIRNCPMLNEIKMACTKLGAKEFTSDFVVNPQVKSLDLRHNKCLGNESVKKIAFACPNLQLLNLSYCCQITEEAIEEVLKRCPEIRHLSVNRCKGVKKFLIDFELPKLEVICATKSSIDDEGLSLIGKNCRNLLQLNLRYCVNVTEKGVKEVVQNCRSLQEINLKWCDKVSFDTIARMVFSRPSLRRIIPPSGSVPTESQKNFYLQHGCLVYEG
ncbi:hypothetical protein UlMin_017790 [Ulmus minor]